MTYLAIYYLFLLMLSLFFLHKAEKSRDLWRDRYWIAQSEIDGLYEVIMNNNLLKKDE